MSQKRAATGFKGIALAPVTENTLTSYKTSAAESLPYAGSMSRTSKESSTDLYYDDDLYAQIKNVMGEDVELHMAEVPLERMAALGLGTYDEEPTTRWRRTSTPPGRSTPCALWWTRSAACPSTSTTGCSS